jgi:membrane fusion protein (multidrug efflux system)
MNTTPRRARPLLAALTLALAACGGGQEAGGAPKPAVTVATLATQPVTLSRELPGRTSPFAVSEIRPQVSGIIQKRLFVEGSTVKKGQPLYQIDPAPYRAVYDNALANLATTKAKAERYQRLMDKLLEKDRDARFRNADEVIGFLARKMAPNTDADATQKLH